MLMEVVTQSFAHRRVMRTSRGGGIRDRVHYGSELVKLGEKSRIVPPARRGTGFGTLRGRRQGVEATLSLLYQQIRHETECLGNVRPVDEAARCDRSTGISQSITTFSVLMFNSTVLTSLESSSHTSFLETHIH